MVMAVTEGRFKIIEQRDCPHYTVGDEFVLSCSGIKAPRNKAVCLFLSQAVKDFYFVDGHDGDEEREKAESEINCIGCTGVVKIHMGEEETFHTPQMQMLARVEAKRKRAKKMGMLESILKISPLFECIDEKTLSDIVICAQEKLFASDDVILRKGAPGKHLFIIVSGQIGIFDETGSQIVTLGRGEVFGEMSLFSGRPVCATVRAIERVKVLLLSGKELCNILMRHPFLNMAFSRLLVQRLQSANTQRSMDSVSCMTGRMEEIPPSEVFQMMHENLKSGLIELDLPSGKASIIFNEGEVVRADYNSMSNETAFYAILREKEGRFRYFPGLPLADMTRKPFGGFMKILMEGLRLIDEESSTEEEADEAMAAEA